MSELGFPLAFLPAPPYDPRRRSSEEKLRWREEEFKDPDPMHLFNHVFRLYVISMDFFWHPVALHPAGCSQLKRLSKTTAHPHDWVLKAEGELYGVYLQNKEKWCTKYPKRIPLWVRKLLGFTEVVE